MERRKRKNVQAINYLASKSRQREINRLKLMKLLWLADRYHLLKYGRPILKDRYYALDHGPVPSLTADISRHQNEPYTNTYIEPVGSLDIRSIQAPDLSLFSKSDLEVLDLVWEKFGHMDRWELRDLTHEYPEWKRWEEELKDPTTPNSYLMEMIDFFDIPEDTKLSKSSFFDIPKERIFESLQTYNLRKKFEQSGE